MNLDLVKSQNLAQYSNLLANTQIIDAIKKATKTDNSGKYTSLLEKIESLSKAIEKGNNSQSIDENDNNLDLLKNINNSSSSDSPSEINTSINDNINQLIENAEMLEAMLNLDVDPSEDQFLDLLGKFREILSKLDQELRKIQSEVHEKKTDEVYKLTPSSSTKSGFSESITLVAK